MSSSIETTRPVAKTPFFAAAAFLLGAALLVGILAIRPLGAAELIGLLACVSAASVFAAIPFVVDFTRRLDAARRPAPAPVVIAAPAPAGPSAAELSAQIAAAVDARLAAALPVFTNQLSATLAAAEETRRAEIFRAFAATPAATIDSSTINAPAGAKPRLGRGLAGLIHGANAITSSAPAAPSPDDQTEAPDQRAAA